MKEDLLSQTLGKLLTHLCVLALMPDEKRLAEYVAEFIPAMPGIESAGVLFEDPFVCLGEPCTGCGNKIVKICDECRFYNNNNYRLYAIQTPQTRFGNVLIKIFDRKLFETILPFLSNSFILISIQLENIRNRKIFQDINIELSNALEISRKSEKALRQSEEELRESESKFRYIFEHSIIGKSITFASGKMDVNQAFCDMTGYSKDEFPMLKWQDITHPDDIESSQKIVDSILSGNEESARFNKRYIHKNGSIIWADVSTSVRRDRDGNPLYLMTAISDITSRKEAEEGLKASLREKEVLVREIHHRVKNNLSVILGLLSIQADRIESKEQALAAFNESRDRIYSMALVHQRLYEKANLSCINMEHYFYDISSKLKGIYAPDNNILIESNVKDVFLDVNVAIPIGLILNELITNSLKYAFPENREGLIILSLSSSNGMCYLSVSDNGIGIAEDLHTNTFGMELINLLTGQIDGTLDIRRDKGTQITITFPCQDGGG